MKLPRPGVRPRTAVRTSVAALVLVPAVMLLVALGGGRAAHAAAGDCTPAPNWGTPSSAFADQVLALINQHRTAMGLSPLSTSPTLTASAQWKSLHMAFYGYLAHDDPAPPVARSWSDRIFACGYPGYGYLGENIAYGYATPTDVVNGWLASPGHRANIENPVYTATGIGAARTANGVWYWTQDFGSYLDGTGGGPVSPTVTLTSTPPAATTATGASFAWTATGSPTTTTCSLDGGAPLPCSSPSVFTGLAPGGHTFVVTVANSAGSGSASFAWSVTAGSQPKLPTVTFTRVPAEGAVKAKFAWSTTRAPTSIVCSLDGAPATPCTSPTTVKVARGAEHTFVVTVANAAGSASASSSW